MDPEGRNLAVARFAQADRTISYADFPANRAALDAPGFLVGRPFVGQISRRWMSLCSLPVADPAGVRVGTLAVALDLGEISSRVLFQLAEHPASVMVVDGTGVVVMHSREPAAHIGRMHPAARSLAAAVPGDVFCEAEGLDGQRRCFDVGSLAGTDWRVVASVPTAMTTAPARARMWRSLAVVAVTVALVVALLVVLTRNLTRPVGRLAAAARAQMAGRSGIVATVAGPAEVAATAEAFNRMVASREQAARALQQSEERLALVVQGADLGTWDWHLPTSRVTYNPRWAEMLGYTLGEFEPSHEHWGGLIHPEDRGRVLPAVQAHLAGKTPSFEAEYRLRAKSDRWVWVLDRGRVVERDASDRPVRMAGTMLDITARRLAGQAVQEAQERFRAIVDSLDGIVWEADAATFRFTYVSSPAERILGFPVSRWLEEPEFWPQQMHPDDRKWAPQYCQKCTRDRRGHQFEYRLIAADGRTVWLQDTVSVHPRPDGPGLIRGVMIDITARKQAEAEKADLNRKLQDTQKLESLGVLAGGIAHDFNNLLTGVMGNASLARLDLPAGLPALANLEQIEAAALRAAELCKQMLAYAGKGRFVIQNLELNQVITDTTQLLQISISKNCVLRFNLAAQLPPVSADATQLRQVIMNLVINASEAINERSGVIALSTGVVRVDRRYLATTRFTPDLPEADYVFLEVSDNGAGMDEQTQAQIFDPFFTTKFTGRGLGLAAVLGIVRGHGGAIKVYSERGRGTTFKVLFPIAEGRAEPVPVADDPLAAWRGAGTVLVVDDEETVRAVAARLLESLGFATVTADDGRSALERYRAEPERYTLVLLDLTMPHLDGEETFRQLRLLRSDVKVVLMSGFNQQEAINRFTGKGLAGFVQKPFERVSLARELRRVLAGGG